MCPIFRESFRVQQELPEEGRRAHRLKHCTDNNEDEDNSPNDTNDTNYQASFKKFREIRLTSSFPYVLSVRVKPISSLIKINLNFDHKGRQLK